MRVVTVLMLLVLSAEAFSPSAPLRLSSSAPRLSSSAHRRPAFAGLRMQTKDPEEDDKDSVVDSDLTTLNARIQQIKERESNPILNAQDKIADALEPVQFEAAKLKNKVPDPRAAIPVTGLPKWVLPISLILGLSIFSAFISS